MTDIEAVVFDIDGTLSPEISWLSLTRDLGASVEKHTKIYGDYRAGINDYEQSKHKLIELWQQTGNATRPFFLSIFEKWPLANGAETVLPTLLSKYRVCLITGSMDLYAEIVAKRLSVPEWYANTSLQFDDGGKLVDMDYELDQSKKKLEQFLGYCGSHQIQPEQCVVVGDSLNDLDLFKASGNGIAVGEAIPEELDSVAWREIRDIQGLQTISEL